MSKYLLLNSAGSLHTLLWLCYLPLSLFPPLPSLLACLHPLMLFLSGSEYSTYYDNHTHKDSITHVNANSFFARLMYMPTPPLAPVE
ncbi:hypothetical protein C8R41DRAFT_339681 [Lentinula lateritia]|uniref:Secreted protein n=1 Tax=Lentinula lateritia TaxID=40482 RepID=A0ABQ8VJ94_9AGAR|nr:hypothetical protein C8R41DRAFT_339681 [Lentinula lateritia]